MTKKLYNSKIRKSLISLIAIIILLSSILAASIFYENNITSNVVRETSIKDKPIASVKEVKDINELSQLNEGWYQIRNGFVFYLETFNSYVPLYIKVLNSERQDGLLVVDEEGNVRFDDNTGRINEKIIVDEEKENIKTNGNEVTAAAIRDITGDVTGGQTVTKANIFQRWWCGCTYYLGNQPLKEKDKFWDSQGNEYTVGLFSITMLEKNSITPLPVDDVSKLPANDFYTTKPQEEKTALLPESAEIEKTSTGPISTFDPSKPGPEQVIKDKYGNTLEFQDGLWVGGKDTGTTYTYTAQQIQEGLNTDFFPVTLTSTASAPAPIATPAATLPTPAPATSVVKSERKYDSIDIAYARFKQKDPEFKIGDTITIKGQEHIVRGSVSGEPVFVNKNTQLGETRDGRVAYLNSQDRVVITDYKVDTYNLPTTGCSGSICIKDGVYMSPQEFNALKANEFYLIKSDGTFIRLDATTRRDAEIEKMNYGGDPNLRVVSGSGLTAEKESIPSAQQLIEGKQKYTFQYDRDGKKSIAEIWVNRETSNGEINRIAVNRAGLFGGALVGGSIQRPKFTVTVSGFLEPFKNVEANSEADAVNIIKTQLNQGGIPTANLPISAKPEQIEITGTAKPPEEFRYATFEGKNIVIGPNNFIKEYKTSAEANTAVRELNEQLTLQKYEKTTQDYASKNGLTLLNDRGEDGLSFAKDEKGDIKYFDKVQAKYVPIQGSTYTTYEKIGKGEDKVDVFRTKTKTGEVQEIKVIKGGNSATVDEDTLKRIKDSGGKGFSIVQEREINLPPEENLEQILEFRDPRTGVLLEKQTLNPDYSLEAGTKTTEKFGTAYYYNGNEITKSEVDKLKPEEKNKVVTKTDIDFPTFKMTEEKEDSKLKYLTTYQFDTIFDKDKNPIRTYDAVKTNQQTGQIEEFTYGEGDKKIIIKTPNGIGVFDIFKSEYQMEGNTGDEELLSKAGTHLNQLASRQFFATVERVFTEFQGLGYYSTLFFDEDSLLQWRDNVDRAFATLYLGTEYWSSAICGNYLDGEDEGIAYAETPQGLAQVAAHIEATRTEPITTENGTIEFIYKITFNVRNGDYEKDPRAPEEMKINVVLKGERTVNVFKQEQKVKRGSTFGRTGRNAIVQDSKTLFTEVCLTFDKIPLRWKLDNRELCNAIVESGGAATTIATTTTTTTTTEGGGEEFNDF